MTSIKTAAALALFGLSSSAHAETQPGPWTWRKVEHRLALLSGTRTIWQVVADPAEGKPYFHPIATPDGFVLTDLRPPDHPWHRGLWWSWKFINGLNYWEEDRKTHQSQAATELVTANLKPNEDGSADLDFAIRYKPWTAPPVLDEKRTIHVSTPENGSYEIQWTSEFTALVSATLGRTPIPGEPNGVPFGGYAGLSLRLNPATRAWNFSGDTSEKNELHGRKAGWVRFSAGPGGPAVTIFGDPRNPRSPSPWYVNRHMPYVSPAVLFNEPLSLSRGEKLVLRYRILITNNNNSTPPPLPK